MRVYPGFGPAQHDPLNGDWAVVELRLRLGGPAQYDPFSFHAVSSHALEGTSLARLGLARHVGLARYRAKALSGVPRHQGYLGAQGTGAAATPIYCTLHDSMQPSISMAIHPH
jgi:hypothetical protein